MERNNCRLLNDRIFEHIKSSGIKYVVLVGRWTYYTGSLSRPGGYNPVARDESVQVTQTSTRADTLWAMEETARRYKELGVSVVFVEDNPQQHVDPEDVLRRVTATKDFNALSVTRSEHIANQADVNAKMRSLGVHTVNFDDVLCPGSICPLMKDLRFLYFDDDHLSVDGAMMVYPTLRKSLEALTNRASPALP